MKLLSCLALLALSAAATASTPPPFEPYAPAAGTVTPGRCHMDGCGWVKWLSVTSARDDATGEITVIAQVDNGVSEDEESVKGKPVVAWDNQPQKVTVLCSYSRPTVTFTTSNQGTQVHELILAPGEMVVGYMESSSLMYFQACHSDTVRSIEDGIAQHHYGVVNHR